MPYRTHLVIGTSTGGPVGLREVIPKLTVDLGFPVFVVQHMAPGCTHSLAQRICEASQLQVVEGTMGQEAKPNTFYIALGGKHLQLPRTAVSVAGQGIRRRVYRAILWTRFGAGRKVIHSWRYRLLWLRRDFGTNATQFIQNRQA